jgi:hypothetical protein
MEMRRVSRSLVVVALLAGASLLAACPGGGAPGIPGKGGKASSVDPNTCGNYAASEAGAKLKNFLEASVMLNEMVMSTEAEVKTSCGDMAEELGIPAEGDTKTLCNAVANAIRDNLKAGLKGQAKLQIDYTPAVCTVSADVAASAAAKCEGSASADVKVRCEGSCSGTCQGTCQGKCDGKAGTGGSVANCNGQCEGTCQGECSGGCEGSADVQASAECEAHAEVQANVQAECTEPELNIAFDASMTVDKPKVEKVVAALKRGMPKLLQVSVKIGGPVRKAFTTWAKAAKDLSKASGKLYSSLGDQATCVAGQLAAAAGMVAQIDVLISVQVEASASVSGSAGGGT